MMKTIQITIDDLLLQQIDEVVQNEGITRSAYIREVLTEAIKRYHIAQLEKQDREGYLRQPQTAEELEEIENTLYFVPDVEQ